MDCTLQRSARRKFFDVTCGEEGDGAGDGVAEACAARHAAAAAAAAVLLSSSRSQGPALTFDGPHWHVKPQLRAAAHQSVAGVRTGRRRG